MVDVISYYYVLYVSLLSQIVSLSTNWILEVNKAVTLCKINIVGNKLDNNDVDIL